MPIETRFLASLTLAIAVVYWATPVAIRLATRLDFYDRPTGYKGHAAATPYLGGAAVMAGFLTALALTGQWSKTLPVAGGSLLLWAIGTIDDRRTVTPTVRVTIELALGALLWEIGLGWDLGLGSAVDLAVTAIWVVAVVNALNLFDNMDGQASTVAAVIAGTLALLGLARGDAWLAVAGAALAGACLGFLPHNLASPARIFLGDGGSMPIGFVLATLVMIGAGQEAPAWQALEMGLLLVGVPALDTALVMFSRRRRGLPFVTAGRDHLAHRTVVRLRTTRAVALALGGAQALLAALALVAYESGSVVLLGAVILYLIVAGTLIAVLDSPRATGAVAAPRRSGRVASWSSALRVPGDAVLLVALAAAIALSPLAGGFYDSSWWAPAGLVLIVLLVAAVTVRPLPLERPAVLALGGLTALALWALASTLWAPSVQQAVVEGNRLIMYAVLLGLMLVLARSTRGAVWLLGALTAFAGAFAAFEVGDLAFGAGPGLFLGGRLDAPLGYVNGLAAFHLLALWPAVALAERRSRPWLAGLGIGVATLLVALLLLSQSRGVALAALLTAVVLLAVVPGRTRRACALLALAGATAVMAGPAGAVYRAGEAHRLDAALVRDVAVRALILAVVLGVAWALGSALIDRARQRSAPLAARAQRVVVAAIAVCALAATAWGALNAGSIARTIGDQYEAFVHLAPPGGDSATRLLSGAGNRYDYWRVAAIEFGEAPVAGVGAGNYARRYLEERATTEDVRQPHSLVLQVLAELGLVGLLALVAFAGAIAWAVRRRRLDASPNERFLLVAATGVCCAWLVEANVDWIHLLPGVTGIALAAAAVLLRPREPAAGAATPAVAVARPTRARATVAALALAVPLGFAGVSLSRQVLGEHYRDQASAELAQHPRAALADAGKALRLAPEDVQASYTKAAALARFDDAAGARAVLEQALKRDPTNYVTLALLGDLAIRTGDRATARARYREALRRNPRDAELRRLVRDPGRALAPRG